MYSKQYEKSSGYGGQKFKTRFGVFAKQLSFPPILFSNFSES